MSDRGSRWDEVYRSKGADTVSWFQARPVMSLALIEHAGVVKGAPVIDVGGGASSLVDHLLHEGYADLAVMDLSDSALATSRERLGDRASQVDWIVGDVLAFAPLKRYALWHDRAVFHFLVDAGDRRRYFEALHRASQVGTQVVMATFAEDGPERCSGLPVARYRAAELHAAFGADYELVESTRETHRTPSGAEQHFTWVRMRRVR
ncbi:methyltransferase domain-containing protein [Dyella sp. LX-66]|uniref:class I SAM-dependent methyltransferase n=1 Tax=unclassified Dyella TaxID=2634549 RepID=UPI001BE00990|nr:MULTISPECIES: class I SAM-dependent methyltransferase [unclassified Dyella]MBT2119394.1 methyltransferase domain-containing protein [Dyella sp. LX-1]MBT2138613.1 methyltransferase domain-containing protein [Dyella sp. LX-66]